MARGCHVRNMQALRPRLSKFSVNVGDLPLEPPPHQGLPVYRRFQTIGSSRRDTKNQNGYGSLQKEYTRRLQTAQYL